MNGIWAQGSSLSPYNPFAVTGEAQDQRLQEQKGLLFLEDSDDPESSSDVGK